MYSYSSHSMPLRPCRPKLRKEWPTLTNKVPFVATCGYYSDETPAVHLRPRWQRGTSGQITVRRLPNTLQVECPEVNALQDPRLGGPQTERGRHRTSPDGKGGYKSHENMKAAARPIKVCSRPGQRLDSCAKVVAIGAESSESLGAEG
ncbi:hypothetical protein RF11_01156 [Thelohanellus kitauei]|uniref:Uncharacterized protein n=1 Tax=Thelohanellus kitauei TaxID=669202 RepID=A0A0C2NBQ9_THEKT|nr:hypothetical protein RF11_01156 [Thelohanellus kitauei]